MLDPLTVLLLTGNVIQFVDFASKLFIKGERSITLQKVYQSVIKSSK